MNTLTERWREVPGVKGYEVSDQGRIRSYRKGEPRIIKPRDRRGYLTVNMYGGSKIKYASIHRIVLRTFVGPCPVDYQASHLDGDRHNNQLTNLKWESVKDNNARKRGHGTYQEGDTAANRKLTKEDVLMIRKLRPTMKRKDLAKMFNISGQQIYYICKNLSWRSV